MSDIRCASWQPSSTVASRANALIQVRFGPSFGPSEWISNEKRAFVQFRTHRDLQVGHIGGRIVGFGNVFDRRASPLRCEFGAGIEGWMSWAFFLTVDPLTCRYRFLSPDRAFDSPWDVARICVRA